MSDSTGFAYAVFTRTGPDRAWTFHRGWERGDAIYTNLSAARGVVTNQRNASWRGKGREYKIVRSPLGSFEDFEGGAEWKTRV